MALTEQPAESIAPMPEQDRRNRMHGIRKTVVELPQLPKRVALEVEEKNIWIEVSFVIMMVLTGVGYIVGSNFPRVWFFLFGMLVTLFLMKLCEKKPSSTCISSAEDGTV